MVRWAATAVVVAGLCAPAGAGALQDAIMQRDVLTLEALGRSAPGSEDTLLAVGAALALRHQDKAALEILESLSHSAADKSIRAGACFAASDIYLRQTRYGEAYAALACVERETGKPLTGEPKQILDDTAALAGVAPMHVTAGAPGKIAVRRDRAGLIAVRIAINGQSQRAVIDTDASFSVLSEFEAERLGVRVLDAPLTIVTTSRAAQPMRLGVAERVEFGDSVLTNVVFAVLPDKAVRFGPDYAMNAVIGLPVLVALGRIELAREDGGEVLRYGSAPGAALTVEPNLVLSGLDPFVLVKAGQGGARLRLALDTAADKTTLNGTALREFPAIADRAASGRALWTGVGGVASDSKAFELRELRLDLGGRPVVLKRVAVLSADEGDRHGALGQDVLKQAIGWVLDFERMYFALQN